MYTLKQAQAYAQNLADIHGDSWQVFEIPAAAPARQYPGNVHSKGNYHAAPVSERAEYESGGAVFVGAPYLPLVIMGFKAKGAK
jgi:hypothetical protein